MESCVRCTVSSEVIASSSLCGERKQVESRLKAPFTVTETCRETLPTRWLALFLMVSIFCSSAPRCLSKCSSGMLKLQQNLCGPINIFFVTFHHFVVDKLIIVTFVLSLILLSLLDIYLPVSVFLFYFDNRGVRDERSVRSLTLPEVVAVSKEVFSSSVFQSKASY